jgi:hypothetical protein
MAGEILDALKAFKLGDDDPLIRGGMDYLLSRQNADGSWGDPREKDIYLRYHPTWNAIAGLSEYAWAGEGLSFPEVRPLLEEWARPPAGRKRAFYPRPKSSRVLKSARIHGGGLLNRR